MTEQQTVVDPTALPLRPGTATQVLELLDDPDTSAKDIGLVVNTEPAITARLLALANSPVFLRGKEIADTNQAIVAVGMSSVRGIALGVAMDTLYEDDAGLDPAHWEHALVAAGAAVTTAKHTGADNGEAFCAGLMHDIGEIAMAITSPENWATLLQETKASTHERATAEQRLFGTDHARLGAEILSLFGLPTRLVAAISSHHHPVAEIDSALGRCIAVAEVIAGHIDDGTDATSALELLLPDLGLDAGSLLNEMQEQTDGLRSAFGR